LIWKTLVSSNACTEEEAVVAFDDIVIGMRRVIDELPAADRKRILTSIRSTLPLETKATVRFSMFGSTGGRRMYFEALI
jgi:hypothetical protein